MYKTREDILPAFFFKSWTERIHAGPSDREREIKYDYDRSNQEIVIGELRKAPCSDVAQKTLNEQDANEQRA